MWKKDLRTLLLLLFTMLLWAVFYNMLVSCSKTVYKEIETHDTVYVAHSLADTLSEYHKASDTIYVAKKDTFVKTETKHDSIMVRDSVYVRERGDSVYVYKEKWRTRIDVRHDTVYKSKTDTVLQFKTDTVAIYRYIEKKDSASQVSMSNKEKIKERRSLWTKIINIVLGLGIAAGIIWWLRKKAL